MLIVVLLIIISLLIGRYSLSFSDIISLFSFQDSTSVNIMFHLRLPRILLALLCGGALALAGYVLQALFQNPLVSGDVLGVSQGCSVGAMLAMLLGASWISVQLFSFIGGIICMLICMRMASLWKRNMILHLVLSGIIIGALANAVIMLLKLGADPYEQLPAIEFWLMGSFSSADWKEATSAIFIIVPVSILLYLIRYQIFVLSHGEEEAKTLGIEVKKVRFLAIVCATLLIAASISTAGIISWIGLIAPHIVRLLYKKEIHYSMVDAFLCGGILLLGADTLSRTIYSFEIPISILTSIMGALFLGYLLWKRGLRL